MRPRGGPGRPGRRLALTGPPYRRRFPAHWWGDRRHRAGRVPASRREATSPADVGLPIGPRRRTPGLRRAELATLAGISVDYLIRLEQGRDTQPVGPGAGRPRRRAAARRGGPSTTSATWSPSTPAAQLCPATVPPATRRPPDRPGPARPPRAGAGVRHQPPDRPAGVDLDLRAAGRAARHPRRRRGRTCSGTRSPTSGPAPPTPTGIAIADEQVGNLQAACRPERRRGPGARRPS